MRHWRRTTGRRQAVYEDVVEAVHNLNGLYGVTTEPTLCRSDAQAAVHRRLFEAVSRGDPQAVPDPKSAAREMLGGKCEYSGASAKVHPFGSADVSLPRGLRATVAVVDALGPEYKQV